MCSLILALMSMGERTWQRNVDEDGEERLYSVKVARVTSPGIAQNRVTPKNGYCVT